MSRPDERDARRGARETSARESERDGDQRLVDDLRTLLEQPKSPDP